ncbi:MAG: hypothetical protein RIC55_02960 [Pirellulaceae bacterium]
MSVAATVGARLVERSVDSLWEQAFGSEDQRVRELDRRLLTYETLLRRLDQQQADAVAEFRSELSTRTTAEDVRRIVNPTLAAIAAQVQALENSVADVRSDTAELQSRTEDLDDRLACLEQVFGDIRYIPPAPMLRSSVDGKPQAHPMVLDWVRLLCRSESSRLSLFKLRQRHPEQNEKVQTALMLDQQVVAATQELHHKALVNYANKLEQREQLLKEFLPGTPEVVAFDEQLAASAWLVAVTKPIDDGPFTGRMGTPDTMFGPYGSEIINAMTLSGADLRADVVPLYRQQIMAQAVARKEHPGAGFFEDASKAAIVETTFAANLRSSVVKRNELLMYVAGGALRAQALEQQLQKTQQDYSAQHPQVKSLVREKDHLIVGIHRLHDLANAALDDAIGVYLEEMRLVRPTSPPMEQYFDSVLLDLAELYEATRCLDWDSSAACRVTWSTFCDLSQRKDSPVAVKVTSIAANEEYERFLDIAVRPESFHVMNENNRYRAFDGVVRDGVVVDCLVHMESGRPSKLFIRKERAQRFVVGDTLWCIPSATTRSSKSTGASRAAAP